MRDNRGLTDPLSRDRGVNAYFGVSRAESEPLLRRLGLGDGGPVIIFRQLYDGENRLFILHSNRYLLLSPNRYLTPEFQISTFNQVSCVTKKCRISIFKCEQSTYYRNFIIVTLIIHKILGIPGKKYLSYGHWNHPCTLMIAIYNYSSYFALNANEIHCRGHDRLPMASYEIYSIRLVLGFPLDFFRKVWISSIFSVYPAAL